MVRALLIAIDDLRLSNDLSEITEIHDLKVCKPRAHPASRSRFHGSTF